jgi:hypothetical protein
VGTEEHGVWAEEYVGLDLEIGDGGDATNGNKRVIGGEESWKSGDGGLKF